MERVKYDISHFSYLMGEIGRLMTVSRIPVIAGDSMSINMEAIFRLSKLRKNLYLDANVDLFGFYVPHRHVYGDDWISFMKQGTDESVTFGSYTNGATYNLYYLGSGQQASGSIPKWIVDGYVNIWNRYFRDPTDDSGVIDNTDILAPADGNEAAYGYPCCHDKRLWNAGIYAETDSSDREVSAAGTVVDLTEFAQQQGRLKSELKREWFSQRYNDVLKQIWQSSANTDADQRPTLLARNRFFLSGYDVDGTSETNLGSYSGKAAAVGRLNIPMKFFPEHGCVWIMALVRFPPLHFLYQGYLDKQAEPTYKQIAGDPDITANEPPMALVDGDVWRSNASSNALGKVPYAQWYREQPDNIHPKYEAVAGFPFLSTQYSSQATAKYIAPTEYDDVFGSSELAHWQSQARLNVDKLSYLPDPRTSIFSGTR